MIYESTRSSASQLVASRGVPKTTNVSIRRLFFIKPAAVGAGRPAGGVIGAFGVPAVTNC
jgi:hypothetical protein